MGTEVQVANILSDFMVSLLPAKFLTNIFVLSVFT